MNSMRWVHGFAVLTSLCTLVLLCAGALVTSTDSGLAVPDWPLAYGQVFPPMEGGVFFEHGHRLVAGTVAFMTTLLVFLVFRFEERSWVKSLSLAALGMVLLQALLGGLTVLLLLPAQISIAHACLGQMFFCTTVVLAIVTSPEWQAHEPVAFPVEKEGVLALDTHCFLVSVVFFIQLLLGATMRHLDAGLAITDFPLNQGALIPHLGDPSVAIHFAHRVGAYALVGLTLSLTVRIFKNYSEYLPLVSWSGAMLAFVSVQIVLGALTIWLRRPVPITTAHLAVGALCLACSIGLSLQVYRLRFLALVVPRSLSAAEPLPA